MLRHYTHNTAPLGGWQLKASFLRVIQKKKKNVKRTKIVMVGKGPVGLSYVNKIGMPSIPERTLAGRYSVHASAFIRTRLSRPEL